MSQFVKEGTKVGPKQKSLDVPIKVGAEQGLASLKLSVSSHPKGPGDDGLTEVTGTAVTGSMGPRSDQDLSGMCLQFPGGWSWWSRHTSGTPPHRVVNTLTVKVGQGRIPQGGLACLLAAWGQLGLKAARITGWLATAISASGDTCVLHPVCGF